MWLTSLLLAPWPWMVFNIPPSDDVAWTCFRDTNDTLYCAPDRLLLRGVDPADSY